MKTLDHQLPLALLVLVAMFPDAGRGGEPVRDEQASRGDGAGTTLNRLIDSEWEWRLREQPTFASYLGDRRYNDRWPDVSLIAITRRHQHRVEILETLKGIDGKALTADDRLNLDLITREYSVAVESHAHRWFLVPLTARGGIQDASSRADVLRFETTRDFEQWIRRLQTFGRYMDQTIALMQAGLDQRRVHDREVMVRVPAQISRQIVDDPTRSFFYKPFRRFPEGISSADQQRLAGEARQAISSVVVPAYRRMLVFFNEKYLPGCFSRAGVWQMPAGKEFYAFRCRRFTTTDLTPGQIHQIGKREVKRIRDQMQRVIQETSFKGKFREFLDHLRSDPKFYYKNSRDLLAAYREVTKRIDPQLVKLFRRLPRMPYGVEPIPMHLAPDTTTAYYRPPSADGKRAGTYFVNLYRPEVRPKYEIEALSLHEAVPGHHLQISLAMELENVPPFRRFGGYTAFIEGWGLYAESLGAELGLYRDPYSKFGQLTYEMWRAVRLVVDTGMHYDGWTRQRAIDFFADNTAKTMLDIENEIDRYIAWPGQAVAYKIGELKIQELRRRAEKALGKQFDVREFHEVILSRGAVTLDLLEEQIDVWLKSRK
ncbi:MAG: DUF885 domain-containing protein [Planctomycetaceae bacterium]|jgi:prolyl oligopeptidase|nr:DUF885 domain-containing protein [Planctomycetaceae bacterium]